MGSSGCMALTPQLKPTDFAAIEQVEDRETREQLYAENAIYKHAEPQGTRYTKGTKAGLEKRSWQSLDVILRSDMNASAALPKRELRLARLFTALTVVAGIVTVAGVAASAREGLNLGDLNGTGGLLLGGGLATAAFGITAGVFYGKTKKGYERAVDVYNDSLGVRLGVMTPKGEYIPPRGTIVDEEGYIVLDEAGGEPEPEAEPKPEAAPAAPLEDLGASEPPPAEPSTEEQASPPTLGPSPSPPATDATVPAPEAPPGPASRGRSVALSMHPRSG